MKINKYFSPLLFALMLLMVAPSCQKKRISYTDMVKRESAEIKSFMDKKGFTLVEKLPADLRMRPNEFYELKNEANKGLGVYINVLTPGPNLEDMAISGVTSISTRFSYKVIGERMTTGPIEFSNIGPTESDHSAATFVYQGNINTDFQQGGFQAAPNSTVGEEAMSSYVCNAMMLALKYVPLGSTLQMITSFREGPSFTFTLGESFRDDSKAGVALYYDKITFDRKK